MSELKLKYNHESDKISLEKVDLRQPSASITLCVVNPEAFVFSALRISVVSESKAVKVDTFFPGNGATIEGLDAGPILASRVSLIAGQTSSFTVNLNIDGREVAQRFDVDMPLPEKPFPSWILSGSVWAAPKPYPENFQNKTPVWDESILDWRIT